jgi:outer membrane receptor for ferrienterochelin and colicins
MTRATIFFLLCYFAQSTAFSQSGSLAISVKNGELPLEFVSISLQKSPLGGVTDSLGFLKINQIPYGEHHLKVSLVGFQQQFLTLRLNAAHPDVELSITLTASASLEEVVISGTMKEVSKLESPVPVEVYTSRYFRMNPAPSIFESLQNVNGVRPQLNCNVCNTGDIHINGLEGPYTMVLIDGMPIVSGLSTVYGLTGIPQSLIERVEIVKGPASTLYGSEAVGGLINIITKKPATAAAFSADMLSSGWGEVNTDLGLRFSVGSNSQSLLGINYFNYSNPIDRNGDGFTDITLQNRISVFNKWSFERKANRVFSIAGRYVYEDRWGGDMRWNTSFRGGDSLYGESIYTNRWELFGVYQLPVKEKINLQFSTNGHRQNSVYGNIPYIADQYIGFGQMTWSKVLGQHHDLLVGATYRYIYYDDNTPATAAPDFTNQANVTHLPGLFAQNELTINEQHKLLLGIRYDRNSLHGNIFTPRINYKWRSKDRKNTLRLGVGNGYRVANVFTEDHAALTGARQVVFTNALNPETSWNANLNVVKKVFTRRNSVIGLDASAWYTYFTNRIVPDYETDPNKIIYSNLDGFAVSKGISLNVDIAWKSGLKIMAGSTLMDVTLVKNGVSTRQLLTEKMTGVWSVGYTFQKTGLTLDYTGNLYSPMRLPLLGVLDDRPASSPWFSIQNLQITKKLGELWELYGGVKNLLNYTPPANSIARSFDPFDKKVLFNNNGQVIPTAENPNALTFDPTYVFAANQGIRIFAGVRFTLKTRQDLLCAENMAVIK